MQATSLLRTKPRTAVQHPLPDLAPDGTAIRTPKRGRAEPGREPIRAAQVWSARGHWLVGVFPDRASARAAAKAFIANPDRFPGAVWHKKRCRTRDARYKWVRKVKGVNTWQARPWLGAGRGSLNLGLFTDEHHGAYAELAAGKVALAFGALWAPGVTVGEAVEKLKRHPKHPCRADLVVPDGQRDLLPVAEQPTESARARRRRMAREKRREQARAERKRYEGGLLFTMA